MDEDHFWAAMVYVCRAKSGPRGAGKGRPGVVFGAPELIWRAVQTRSWISQSGAPNIRKTNGVNALHLDCPTRACSSESGYRRARDAPQPRK